MDSALITDIYNFAIKANSDATGVEASLVLSSVAGAAGHTLILPHIRTLEAQALEPGAGVFIESVSSELGATYGELLRYAAAAGLDPDPNSGWIGTPASTDRLGAHILQFNKKHFNALQDLTLKSGGGAASLRSALLGVSCMILKQVGGTVIPEGEGKKIITWSLQLGSKSMPL